MRAKRIISRVWSAVKWTVAVVLIIITGGIIALYTPVAQDNIRRHAVELLNRQEGIEARIDTLRLRFPLDLTIAGVSIVQDGDTLVAARRAEADVAVIPLFAGVADVRSLRLEDAYYRMGTPDSAMYLRLRAADAELKPARLRFSPMDISIEDGRLSGASVDITLSEDTTATDSASETSPLEINVERLRLDNFAYKMRMLPVIDSLGAQFNNATMRQGHISLTGQTVKLRSLSGIGLNAAYIAPTATTETITVPETEAETTVSKPWTVQIDSISFTGSRGLYTTRGTVPQPGLDFAYIEAGDMDLSVTHFYNQATTISLPIRLSATERCGVRLSAVGTFDMDSAGMYFRNFSINTPAGSDLKADGMLGIGDMTTDPRLPMAITASGELASADAQKMFPAFSPYLAMTGQRGLIGIDMKAEGTPARLDIDRMDVRASDVATLKARGYVGNFFNPDRLNARLDISGRVIDGKGLTKALFEQPSSLAIAPLSIDGLIEANGPRYSANINAKTLSGDIALDADIDSRPSGGYDITLDANDFPVDAFLPDMGIGRLTASASATGHGYDLFSSETELQARANITKAVYNVYTYTGVNLAANLAEGNADIDLHAANSAVNLSLQAAGNLTGDTYDWKVTLGGRNIDLMALNFSQFPATLNFNADATARISSSGDNMDVQLTLPSLSLLRDVGDIHIKNVDLDFTSDDTVTVAGLHNRDLTARLASPMGLRRLLARFDTVGICIDSIMTSRRLDVEALQRALPPFVITAQGGNDNIINDILAPDKMSISNLTLDGANDSLLHLDGRVLRLNTGTMMLDTINVALYQTGNRLQLNASLDNVPGNLDNYAHVDATVLIDSSKASLHINQLNNEGKTGFDLGAIAMINKHDDIYVKLFPFTPTIGYKAWTVNPDNYILYNLSSRHIDANLHMQGDDSSLALYTDHPAADTEHNHDDPVTQEDINLEISNIHLSDWIGVNPFAPPMSGDLSANLKVNYDGQSNINGNGTVSLDNLYYDNQRVASFIADLDLSTTTAGTVRAKADLTVDGRKSVTLSGALNDTISASPFNLDLSVIHFPLAVANPFLPAGVARLQGTLNGSLDVSGDTSRPRLDGSLTFDSTAVFLNMTATEYRFSPVEIPVVNNLITFNNFSVTAANDNPLTVNGTVDISDFASPRADLRMKARNMMIVNSQRAARGADIYGKAYIDLDASVKGDTRFMAVNADLKVLSGTDVTYALALSPTAITDRSMGDMVKFVNLSDSLEVANADSIADPGMMMAVNALLTLQNNTTITVNLPTGARDKVVVNPQGTLNYTMAPMSEGRLTGRLNLNSGSVSYSLPVVMSEKHFTFDEGSYVAFNGNMMNPTLNIHLTDRLKANVTQTGQNSRLIDFDVMLGVTGTLDRMDVAFDLSTKDDITVANELQSMTAEQRANQAMNMLLYNVYTGPGTKASANLSANPLYSFLESQVNNWAANNIKGVDLSFGIDQFNRTTDGNTASAMSYSYRISKTLFNDRFKIAVGGNYTSDASSDENLSQNLINDISFEYYLNSAHTMLLKIFRHTGFESILEGEVTQTGVGFTYRRRVPSLIKMVPKFMRPLFQWRKPKPIPEMPQTPPEVPADSTTKTPKAD